MTVHPIPPVFDGASKILILGSFPSVQSRKTAFFYGNPQNRFWRVLAAVLSCSVPATTDEKKRILLENGIALWDVIGACDIEGSADSSIRNVVPSDLTVITKTADIERVFANGGTAYSLYVKYGEAMTGLAAEKLPSTSPANASWSEKRLIEAWKTVADRCKKD